MTCQLLIRERQRDEESVYLSQGNIAECKLFAILALLAILCL